MFEPDMEDIWSAYDTLVDETRNRNIRLYLGCEFHANMEMVETLDRDLRPTLADSRYVLTEFSSSSTRAFIKERADALLTAGYYPIIAHIERYRALRKDFDFYRRSYRNGVRDAGQCRCCDWKKWTWCTAFFVKS